MDKSFQHQNSRMMTFFALDVFKPSYFMFLNQVITCAVFFHRFTFVCLRIFSFIVSNKDLLIFPMFDFDGFFRQKDNLYDLLLLEMVLFIAFSLLCHLFLTSLQFFVEFCYHQD